MLSLPELARAVALVDRALRGARVERVVQVDDRRLVVSLRTPGGEDAHLLLCADPASARLSRLPRRPAAPPAPPPFAQLLRARLAGARLTGARIVDDDRQAALRFAGPEGEYELLLSLLGPRSNVYLLDADARLVGALRPLAETRRDLAGGAPWRSPPSPPPRAGSDRFAATPDDDFFAALEAAAAACEAGRAEDALRQRLERALRRAAASLERKRAALRGDLEAGATAEALRRQGELLKSVLGSVRPGDRVARARDFESGAELEIPLDPARSPRENLEALFRRARKAETRAARALRELGELEAREEALAALARDFETAAAAGPDALAAFAARPEVERLAGRFAPPRPSAPAPGAPAPAKRRVWKLGRRELPPRLAPRVYRTADGLEIWVGRSDEGNDLLSTRLASGRDLFFHLDAAPGSHVVLRTEGRADPPAESLLDACELAVHFSKARRATTADVLVAPCKQVHKPRGAKPGLVQVTGGRRIRLRRDPRRLERVLASREDGDAPG